VRRLAVVVAPLRGAVRIAARLPRVVDAVLVLPRLADQLAQVNRNTDALPDMLAELRAVRADTASLPRVEQELIAMRLLMAQIEANTDAVERLAEVAVPLQGAALRVGRFADRLPQRRAERG
jgi:hypothetical protein